MSSREGISTTMDERYRARPIPGTGKRTPHPPRQDHLTPDAVLAALTLVRRGDVFDLDIGRWPGFPLYPTEPPFQVLTYRTPSGLRADGVFPEWTAAPTKVSWISEVLIAGTHSGTHIDALAHVTKGADDHWFGGRRAVDDLGDFGPRAGDTCGIPPIVTRGVLIDVAAFRGVSVLPGDYIITLEDVRGALEQQRSVVAPGDAVLVRTGYLGVWDTDAERAHFGSGLGFEAACWLADQGVVLLAADNEGVEHLTFRDEDLANPIPIHVEMLVERGVHLLEMVYLEELVKEETYEFLFLCLSPKTRGTTGAFVRPVAIL
jgi:kynurenine formamidase